MSLVRTVLDWETAFGKSPTGRDVTLSKMTTEAYVRDPEFKVHGLGVKVDHDPAFYLYKKDDLLHFLKTHPWDRSFAICHHSHFDGAIFSWRCGVRPALWGCTLSMARALFPQESCSLGNLVKLLGLPPKGHELVQVKDKWVLTDEEQRVLGGYCINDVEITSQAFDRMKVGYPVSELRLIDLTVRLFTEPVLRLNPTILQEEIVAEQQRKQELLARVDTDKKVLMSNDQFAALLLDFGIDPPKKLSPSKVKDGRVDPSTAGPEPIGLLPDFKAPRGASVEERTALKEAKTLYPWAYAFGKSDEAFKQMLEHENPAVQVLVEARLGVKSTINETRAQRMLGISERGTWPVYLTYCAAATHRFGGGDKMNPQNFTRGSRLRTCIEAPPGHELVIIDLSQIEARCLAVLAGQTDVVARFARGEDIYCEDASMIFGMPVTKKDKMKRFLGKTVRLGCGYSLGWSKFSNMIRVGMLGGQGIVFDKDMADLLGVRLDLFTSRNYARAMESKPGHVSENAHLLHCACAKEIIDRYRAANPKIVALWRQAHNALPALAADTDLGVTIGEEPQIPVKPGRLVMPSGLSMHYPGLKCEAGSNEWSMLKQKGRRKEKSKVYGGLIIENITQSLARIVITDAMLRVHAAGIKLVMQVHDEVIACVPEGQGEATFDTMQRILSIPPAWAPSLPLDSDGGVDKCYSK